MPVAEGEVRHILVEDTLVEDNPAAGNLAGMARGFPIVVVAHSPVRMPRVLGQGRIQCLLVVRSLPGRMLPESHWSMRGGRGLP